jgi:hypothetical protein
MILMADYWAEFDGLSQVCPHNFIDVITFAEWFVKKATPPELIRRARQWLTEHNYFIVKEPVAQNAQKAGQKFRQSVRGG